jgi:hypothetical protein
MWDALQNGFNSQSVINNCQERPLPMLLICILANIVLTMFIHLICSVTELRELNFTQRRIVNPVIFISNLTSCGSIFNCLNFTYEMCEMTS